MSLPKLDEGRDKPPESIWLQHKDILRRLYIAENKPLSVVKQTMEDEHGFQPQRLCDYEAALRDVLHFRKNLKRAEWRAIGIHIAERKKQAKESEVIWNNTPFEAKKLRKELLRNSRPRSGRTPNVNPALPQGLVIRTPPRSPATSAAILRPSPGVRLDITSADSPQAPRGRSKHPDNSSSAAYETIWEIQRALVETGEFSISPYRKLRGNLPFNRCMSRILDFAQSRRLQIYLPNVEIWTPVSPRLFGNNPSWEFFGRQVYRFSNNRSIWAMRRDNDFLEWLAVSADFTLLRSFFSINSPTAGAVYETLLVYARRRAVKDLIRVLFALRPALRPNNPTSVDDTEFVRAAVQMGSRPDGGLDILNACLRDMLQLSTSKKNEFRHCASPCVLVAASRGDISMLRVLIDAGWRAEHLSEVFEILDEKLIGRLMSRICSWDLQEENCLVAFVDLLLQAGVLDDTESSQCSDDQRPKVITEPCIISFITWDELVMICPSFMRQTLQMVFMRLRPDRATSIDRAGVFTAAQDGASGLRAYLEAHREDDPFRTRVTLEESLLFAAILDDLNTVRSLLEVGVDPGIGLLSMNLERYKKGYLPWNPSIVAATAGNLEVLALLLSRTDLSSFLKAAPIHELVQRKMMPEHAGSGIGREPLRLANLRRLKLVTEGKMNVEGLWDARISTGRNYEALEYIRIVANAQDHGRKVNLEIIKAAVCHQRSPLPQHSSCDVLLIRGLVDAHLDYREKQMDLLHLSIRNHCSLTVVRFLSDKGFKVHSKPNGQNGNTMLHDALLSKSPDRSEIVEFLLKQGADCKIRGDGPSILEASLYNFDKFSDNSSEYRRIFERLLCLGASAHQWRRERLMKWKPLVQLLLNARASDDLILQIVDAGAPLNACGYGHPRHRDRFHYSNMTPLQATLHLGRERLARELIRRGADVHAPASPRYGFTALQAACGCDLPIRFLEYLVVVQGSDTNERPAKISGFTSLAAAAGAGSLNIVEFLLDHGADVNATCRRPIFPAGTEPLCRPLDLAVWFGKLDTVEFLLKAGGRSAKAGLGGAIEIAAKSEHYAILSVLRSWNEKHGRRILEEEAQWHRQNPEQALNFFEPTEDSDYSRSDDSDYDDDEKNDCDT